MQILEKSTKKLPIMSVNKRRPLGKQEDIFHHAWRNRQEAKELQSKFSNMKPDKILIKC